jgi:hypothetical protein
VSAQPARKTFPFHAVHSEGGLLPQDLLQRIADADPRLPGITPEHYHLAPTESLRDAASRAWSRLTGHWSAFQGALAKLATDDPATAITRDRWLLPLFSELGYGRLPATRAVQIGDHSYTLFHVRETAVHLLGARVDLDRRTPSVTGAATAAPHSLVQDFLNRSDDHLWGFLSNGLTLRVLRDHHALTRQAYVEFDLEAIFRGEQYSDFVLLFLTCHQSRVAASKPENCWLEQWRSVAQTEGTRALDRLRDGVTGAIERLGSGFLRRRPPALDNSALHLKLARGELTLQDYYRQLLRLVYRLIFLFVAEDRQALHTDDPDQALARARYQAHYSTRRLRRLAETLPGTPHTDLWQSLRLVLQRLDEGEPLLALPALGSFLWSPRATPDLDIADLANEDLLAALRTLSTIDEAGRRRAVNWQTLDAEELGSVYESLLELHPRLHRGSTEFKLEARPGHERKTSGSYYTPAPLVECLLKQALDPVIERCVAGKTRDAAVAAILDLKICDPACGSGHFLVAASRRIARALASYRSQESEPTPRELKQALRDVIRRCIFGVDLNPMAVELCKVSLWMESIEPGKPLSFLDSHIQHGNALFGATPKLIAAGIPDEAWTALEGDDSEVAKRLKRRNKDERKGNRSNLNLLDDASPEAAPDSPLRATAVSLEQAPEATRSDLRAKERAYSTFTASPAYQTERLHCDTWCAAFVWPKMPDTEADAPTHGLWARIQARPETLPNSTGVVVQDLAASFNFFHWHLAFPQVFARGGFDVILGNPPWDTLSPDAKEFFSAYNPEVRFQDRAGQERIINELLALPEVPDAWTAYRRGLYGLVQFLKESGRFKLYAEGNLGKGDFNVYRMFVELALEFIRPGGFAAQIVPEGIYNGANCMAIRAALFERFELRTLLGFENARGIWFPGIDTRAKFALYAACAEGHTDTFAASFNIRTVEALHGAQAGAALKIPVSMVREFSEDALAIMELHSQRDIDIATKMYARWPKFGEVIRKVPYRHYMRELDMGTDREQFSEDPDGYPLYEGRMVAHYDHRAKGYRSGRGRSADWHDYAFSDPDKKIDPQWHVSPGDIPEKLDDRIRVYRVGFCDVASPTNERSLVAAILPPHCVAGDKVPTVTFDTESQTSLISWISVANTATMDFLARKKISLKMSYTVVDSLPFPRLSAKSPLLGRLAPLVLGLTCTSSEMLDLWDALAKRDLVPVRKPEQLPGLIERDERSQAIAEIEAIVAYHLYGLERDELAHILDTFPIVQKREEKEFGEYVTKKRILAAYDTERRAGPPALPTIESEFPDSVASQSADPEPAASSAATTTGTSSSAPSPASSTPQEASDGPVPTFRLEPPSAPRQRRLTAVPVPATPAPARSSPPAFTLAPPPSQPGHLPATRAEPPRSPAVAPAKPPPAPTTAATAEPRWITALRDGDDALAKPDVLALLGVLHTATAPMSKSELVAAASLDESRWTPLTRLLLDAGLIVKEGDRRTTRYKLP